MHFFRFFGLIDPLSSQEISIPFVGEGGGWWGGEGVGGGKGVWIFTGTAQSRNLSRN